MGVNSRIKYKEECNSRDEVVNMGRDNSDKFLLRVSIKS